MVEDHERRKYGRIELDEPLPGAMGDAAVTVVELSVGGFRVAHETRFQPGESRELQFTWSGRPLHFACRIIRSTLFRIAVSAGQRSIFHSGTEIREAFNDSEHILREMIAQRVMRALEEQKANARGLPPAEAWVREDPKADRFRRYELADGVWRKMETRDPKQPPIGFTVALSVDPRNADLLCRTYESANEEGRRLTRMLAELSIKKGEGGATRRYYP